MMNLETFEYRFSCLSYRRFTNNNELASRLIIALIVFPARPSGPASVWVCKEHLNLASELGGPQDFDWIVDFLLDVEEKLVSCILPELAILALGLQLEMKDQVLQFSPVLSISNELFDSRLFQDELRRNFKLIPRGEMLSRIIQHDLAFGSSLTEKYVN
jgi:hypothetical protein